MTSRFILFLVAVLIVSSAFAGSQPRASAPEASFDFGKAVRGTAVSHFYKISNTGEQPLRIQQLRMTKPLRMVRVSTVIEPHSDGTLEFALDTSALKGDYEGVILLTLNDPSSPDLELGFKGRVVEKIEVSPIPALFLAVTRGESRRAQLEIINHESEPLQIISIESPQDLVSTRCETIEAGQHYKLVFTANADGPTGKHSDWILVQTSSKETPLVRISANIYFHERVYTFPDALDMGSLQLKDLQSDPRLATRAAQTLMVYQVAGTDFRIQTSSDVPSLRISEIPGPKGDRYEVTVMLDPDKVKPGEIKGSIIIRTNDSRFPKLTVPVTGSIAP